MKINCAPTRFEFLQAQDKYQARGLTQTHYERWLLIYKAQDFLWYFPHLSRLNGWSQAEVDHFIELVNNCWHGSNSDIAPLDWDQWWLEISPDDLAREVEIDLPDWLADPDADELPDWLADELPELDLDFPEWLNDRPKRKAQEPEAVLVEGWPVREEVAA